jgi:YgiT-type zinc finger domain-containing protein
MENVICEVCGDNNAVIVKRSFNTTRNELPVCIEDIEMQECARCGESTMSPEEAHKVSEKLSLLMKNSFDV